MSVGDKVELQCALFRRMPGGYFRMAAQNEEPVYVVFHGGSAFTLPFRGIRKEFEIAEGSHDDLMLRKVEEALGFVSALSPGDSFPAEMVDRRASWQPAEQDKRYAMALLRSGLVSWHRGQAPTDVVDPQALVARMEHPDMREACEAAMRALAQDPNSGIPDVKTVARHMQDLAAEIASCEYIFRKSREGFSLIEEKLNGAATLYKRDSMVSDQISRCIVLLEKAKDDVLTRHAGTAANYGEAYSIIRNVSNALPYIKDARDRHYKYYRLWEDLFQKWSRVSVVEDRTFISVVEATYRVLAPRYAPIQEWVTFLTDSKTRTLRVNMFEW